MIVWEIKLYWASHYKRAEYMSAKGQPRHLKVVFPGHFVSDAMNNTIAISTEITLLEYKR